MNHRKQILFLLTVFCLWVFIACTKRLQDKNERTIEDMLGRKVSVPQCVERVVGIRAGSLRLLVYMNAAEKVVGIEEGDKLNLNRPYLTAHPEFSKLPRIGPLMGGDAELIINTHPDVIFSAYTTASEADDLQQKTGIPVIALECPELGISTSRDTLYTSLRLIGKVLQKEARADSLIAYMEAMIRELDNRAQSVQGLRPSVYIGGVSYGAMKDIASTQPYYPPFLFIHARNVAESLDKRLISHVKGTYIDKEQLMVWNPDYLFFDESGLNLIFAGMKAGSALYENLQAVKNHKMFILAPYNNYAVNYELVFVNCWFAGKVLYPEAFSDIHFENKANEILQLFLGKSIFNDLITENSFRQIKKEDLK
jgi:iron complex transport system substrate-binding protein